MMCKKAVLFDIDGTIADIAHRRIYLDGQKPDWKKFNSLMGDDTPNIAIVQLYKALWKANEFDLVLVSGRSEANREVTERWLVWNEIPFSKLLMRPDKDFRPDTVVKEEILNRLKSGGVEILLAIDDRQVVVDMWRRNGVTCLQCDVGDF